MAETTTFSLVLPGEMGSGVEQNPDQLTAQLYTMHASSLHRYLLLTGSRPADADELLQEAFLRLFRCIRNGEQVDNPKAWLIRVLQNLRTDRTRREATQTAIVDSAAQSCRPLHGGRGLTAEQAMIEQQRFDRLYRAMSTLSERQQQYMLLRSEGLTLREIAEIHNVAVQSVAETCARAIERLRKLIDE